MIPPTPLEKGGNRIGSPPFEGGFRGIELELEATPPTLKYAPPTMQYARWDRQVSKPPSTVNFFVFRGKPDYKPFAQVSAH